MLTPVEREIATFTCPQCRRRSTVLADEYGDHGCSCGWDPDNDVNDEEEVAE